MSYILYKLIWDAKEEVYPYCFSNRLKLTNLADASKLGAQAILNRLGYLLTLRASVTIAIG